ncbi:MAG: type II toxin-antitoxin system HicA family toxin [Nostoc sp.]|uniref:type II toxin-antitoxin system HicA family toxin n=1 Tax=Nostoc sp. TaxID=1180 RepID=UPI002FFD1579
MSERIRRMTSREVETILKQYGFQLISQKGSHRKWRSEDLGLQVIVPEHRGALYLSVHYGVSSKGRKFLNLNGNLKMRSRPFPNAIAKFCIP